MKGKEIMEFLKTQIIIECPIVTAMHKHERDEHLLNKYKERADKAYETN